MSETPLSTPGDAPLLEAVLNDTQNAYALLLTLIENRLRLDPAADPAETQPLDAQIQDATAKADAALEVLRGLVEPWNMRRAAYPAETASKVDRFLALLEKGLEGLQGQVVYRTREVELLRADLQESLRKLHNQRAAFQGYRQKGDKSRLLNKKA